MKLLPSKVIITAIIILAVIGLGLYTFSKSRLVPAPVVEVKSSLPKVTVIGKSVAGRNIEAYTYGYGSTTLAFVGGIHGGYEWNSVLLAYTFIDYLNSNPDIIPKGLTVAVIPSANPDGIFAVTGKEGRFTASDIKTNLPNGTGRFNNNKVDLNRNFACNWQATSTWKTNIVSAGTAAFSEPEALAIKNFVANNNPAAVIFWHSQSNAVYASECNNGILPKTLEIMNTYAKAAGYPAVNTFSSYKITGDAEGWLASINIPAITVELKTHETVEWDRNLAGIKALFEYYSKAAL